MIRPSVGFYFTDDAPARVAVLMRLGRQTFDIAPGQKNYRITDSYVVPVDIQVQALKPHAHYLARELKALVTLPDGTTKRLLYIRDWDFKWQNVYRFVAPVALPRGSTLAMEFTYDNSENNPGNPNYPPRRVRWGPASSDEMGDLWLQVLTHDDAARSVLARDFRPKAAAEEIVGYRGLLDQEPDNPILNDDIALLYLELGQPDSAVAHFERSLRAQPDSATGHFNLGTALMFAGRVGEAVSQLRDAVRLKPDYVAAHNNLGNALAAQDRLDEALSHYVAALRAQPAYARAHNGVATVLMQQGQFEEALTHLRNAIEIDPVFAEAHHNMALTQQARGHYVEAARYFRNAVRLRPDSPEMLADCAWILATAPEELVRDSAASIELGEMAATLTRRLDARVLDVVAAAYAEAGRFDKALATVTEAISLNPPEALLRRLLAHQTAYRQGRPARIGAGLP
jgi:tetratricopeptide (TPR) repeat protein